MSATHVKAIHIAHCITSDQNMRVFFVASVFIPRDRAARTAFSVHSVALLLVASHTALMKSTPLTGAYPSNLGAAIGFLL
jgi:hypothetical protein